MNLPVVALITSLISRSVTDNSSAQVAAPPSKVVMTIGAISEREGVVYVAHDQGLFRKHGLDLTLVQVRNGAVGIAAVSSGQSQVHWGSVSAANIGAIAEGADLIFLAGFINKLTGTFVVNPRIKAPADLKGKSIGVNGLSGGAWIFAMLTLDYWGLAPERDNIQFRPLGDQGVIAQGLSAGTVDAAFLGYTFGKALEGKGFRVLADVEELPIPYQGSGIMARRSFSASSPAIIENVLRGLLDGLAFIRDPANKPAVMKSLAKGLRLKRVEEAEGGYQTMLGLYEKKIYPSADGIRNVIRLLGKNSDKIRRLKAEELVDDSFVRKLEKEGLF
ncbi:MAG TPA: ABC transporter substrate-binding protein [Terriglobales bacterium]|jgi:NitT/TauT family transport system substrate-binding protein|nr:ABC transporter substrate-binding protein [Terriglobales bacterium]